MENQQEEISQPESVQVVQSNSKVPGNLKPEHAAQMLVGANQRFQNLADTLVSKRNDNHWSAHKMSIYAAQEGYMMAMRDMNAAGLLKFPELPAPAPEPSLIVGV